MMTFGVSRKFNCVVVCVHHTGKNAALGMRGWSGLHGATDAEFEVSAKNGIRYVHIRKMKDGEDGLGWSFALKQVVVGEDDGDPVTTCVVDLLSDISPIEGNAESGAQSRPKKDLPRSLRVFDEALTEALIAHGKLIWLTGADAKSVQVKAVDLQIVRKEFSKRWVVIPDDEEDTAEDDAKAQKRKRDKTVSEAFRGVVNKLPRRYRTEVQGNIQYIWKLECKS